MVQVAPTTGKRAVPVHSGLQQAAEPQEAGLAWADLEDLLAAERPPARELQPAGPKACWQEVQRFPQYAAGPLRALW